MILVWLDAPDEVLVARAASGGRPLLGSNHALRLAELRDERSPFYTAASCCRVDSSGELDEVARVVCARVEEQSC